MHHYALTISEHLNTTLLPQKTWSWWSLPTESSTSKKHIKPTYVFVMGQDYTTAQMMLQHHHKITEALFTWNGRRTPGRAFRSQWSRSSLWGWPRSPDSDCWCSGTGPWHWQPPACCLFSVHQSETPPAKHLRRVTHKTKMLTATCLLSISCLLIWNTTCKQRLRHVTYRTLMLKITCLVFIFRPPIWNSTWKVSQTCHTQKFVVDHHLFGVCLLFTNLKLCLQNTSDTPHTTPWCWLSLPW